MWKGVDFVVDETTQQTQDVQPIIFKCCPNVYDAGPTLTHHCWVLTEHIQQTRMVGLCHVNVGAESQWIALARHNFNSN